MLKVMDKLFKKRNVFSGNTAGKNDAKSNAHQEIYYEGQNTNGPNTKEEQEEMMIKKGEKGRFFANYNRFF
jgi:hypothetical protein